MKKYIVGGLLLLLVIALTLLLIVFGDDLFHSHIEYTDPGVAATCTTPGRTAEARCLDCGEILVPGTQLAPTGHTIATTPHILPTCSSNGYTAGRRCQVCGWVIEGRELLKATGHSYTSTEAPAADCSAEYIKTYTCRACGDQYETRYSAEPYRLNELFNLMLTKSAKVMTYDEYGAIARTTMGAVIASDGRILTTYAAIDRAERVAVSIGQKTYPVNYVLAYDVAQNFAVLQIGVRNLDTTPLCLRPMEEPAQVYAFTLSNAASPIFTQVMADTRKDAVHYSWDGTFEHNGGLLINEYGEVVGLVASKREATKSGVAVLPSVIAGAPEEKMTLAQVRQRAVNAYDCLAEYAQKNGKYDSWSHTYQTTLGSGMGETRRLIYDTQAQVIRLEISSVNTIEGDLYLDIAADNTGTMYTWSYEGMGYRMNGRVQAKTYTSTTRLLSDQDNIPSADKDERIVAEDYAAYLLRRLCENLRSDLKKVNLGLKDLGFTMF